MSHCATRTAVLLKLFGTQIKLIPQQLFYFRLRWTEVVGKKSHADSSCLYAYLVQLVKIIAVTRNTNKYNRAPPTHKIPA